MQNAFCSSVGMVFSRLWKPFLGGTKRRRIPVVGAVGLAVLLAPPAGGANLAPLGSGILGVNDSIDGDGGTPRFRAGVLANITDGDPSTRVDNWFGGDAQVYSYVGVVWPVIRYDQIESLSLTLATFRDGGWFGVSGFSSDPGTALLESDLIEPTVQVSTDGGVTWATVSHHSDYLTVMNGHTIGGGTNPNPTSATSVFTLDPPVNQINGIRIIGENGGLAGTDENGFLGVFELEVTAGLVSDIDSDGMDDTWESDHGLDVGLNDATADPDHDGLINIQEFAAHADPQASDTDQDGLEDGAEVGVYHTNAVVADTDGDGLEDGLEVNSTDTNPLEADTDGDGLSDGDEVNVHHSNPNLVDTDGDAFNDALEVASGTDPNSEASVPGNVALIGTAIIGTKESMDSGTEVPWANAGVPANINDGNLLTRVDTWNGTSTDTVSYVGILWDEPLSRAVTRLELSLAIFSDGGWFGVNGIGPGAGGTLSSVHLRTPNVQITFNRGAVWESPANLPYYTLDLDDHPLPTVSGGPPTTVTTTWELHRPDKGINGVRIIGSEGGTASGGFLGVFELVVEALPPTTPEPVRLLNPIRTDADFQFEFDSQVAVTHVVRSKASFSEEWGVIGTISGDGTRKTVTVGVGPGQRFYQVTSE